MSERLIYLLAKAKAQQVRRNAIAHDLPDSLASKYPSIYPVLKKDGLLVKSGTRIRWGEKVKRAAVDLWDLESNNPDNAPTLWENLDFYKGYRIIPEIITATLAFSENEIGYWSPTNKFYRAVRNGVVYTPAVYPADWVEVQVP